MDYEQCTISVVTADLQRQISNNYVSIVILYEYMYNFYKLFSFPTTYLIKENITYIKKDLALKYNTKCFFTKV